MSASAALIAIIDDDWPVLKALDRQLRKRSFKTATFRSATEFLAKLPQERPDCLILDLRLPGLNGFELRERLRMRGSRIPIVFITGDGGPSPTDPAAHADTESLAKPFSDNDLIAAISRAISIRAAGVS